MISYDDVLAFCQKKKIDSEVLTEFNITHFNLKEEISVSIALDANSMAAAAKTHNMEYSEFISMIRNEQEKRFSEWEINQLKEGEKI